MKNEKKIINFFINDYVNVFYEDKSIEKYSLYDFKDKKSYENKIDKEDSSKSNSNTENEIPINEDYYYDDEDENNENISEEKSNKLVHSIYCNKIKKLINIYDNNELCLENL